VLLVSAMLRGLRRVDAATRYAIWWGTLLAIICWPAVTFTRLLAQTFFLADPVSGSLAAFNTASHHVRRPLVQVTVPSAPVWALRIVVALWLASVVWKLSRLALACWQLSRVKRSCVELDDDQLARMPLWRKVSQRGRGALLCVSDRVGVACALGFRQPMIALPRQFVEQLTSRDLDQVALHEYAHLQRRDDWARLVQLGVDAICGWHPAVRWISTQLTFEREVACDDWVVQRTRDPLGYARCLTNLAEHTIAGSASTLSPAAWSTQAVVVRRVQRVLDARRNTRRSASRWRLAIAVAVVALCAGEASRVLALQDATDRIVASTPMGGSLSDAVTAEAFRAIGATPIDLAGLDAVEAAPPSHRIASAFGVGALAPAIAPSSIHPIFSATTSADRDEAARTATADTHARDAAGSTATSALPIAAALDPATTPEAAAASVLPSVQHAIAPHGAPTDDQPVGSAPLAGLAPFDLSAAVDDLVVDDDVDHEAAPPTLDQPTHSAGKVHVRAVRPRTRGTGFFARVGRSIVHILGTHTRSPGVGSPDARRRRA
jgi:beta-lactamase regulating signal transducer with metallopeptidase domain